MSFPRSSKAYLVAIGLAARVVHAQEVPLPPVVHVDRPAVLEVEDGRRFLVPPSVIVRDDKWAELDAELKRLQGVDRETSVPTDLGGWIQPYVWVFAGGFVLGVAGTVLAVKVFTPVINPE